MALWLQAASLLVLLALSPPSTNADTPRHLCGSHLVEALYLVCGNKGFVYHPNSKRDVSPVLGFLLPKAARGEKEVDQEEMMMKRGIVDECCNSPCSIFVLQKYCSSLY